MATTRISNCFTKTDLWNEDRLVSSHVWGMSIAPYTGQIKVYLAGKIYPYDWRHSFINIRGESGYMGGDLIPIMRKFFFTHYGQSFRDLLITGPFFISCDHSCFHGDNTHGVGNNKETCDGESLRGLQEKDVVDICLTQISNSDIVFSYIEDNTCYGTIAELGYARKKNKKIFIVFKNPKLADELWFVKNMADQFIVLDGDNVVERQIVTVTEKDDMDGEWTHDRYEYFPIDKFNLSIDFYPIKPIINKFLPDKYIIK